MSDIERIKYHMRECVGMVLVAWVAVMDYECGHSGEKE